MPAGRRRRRPRRQGDVAATDQHHGQDDGADPSAGSLAIVRCRERPAAGPSGRPISRIPADFVGVQRSLDGPQPTAAELGEARRDRPATASRNAVETTMPPARSWSCFSTRHAASSSLASCRRRRKTTGDWAGWSRFAWPWPAGIRWRHPVRLRRWGIRHGHGRSAARRGGRRGGPGQVRGARRGVASTEPSSRFRRSPCRERDRPHPRQNHRLVRLGPWSASWSNRGLHLEALPTRLLWDSPHSRRFSGLGRTINQRVRP